MRTSPAATGCAAITPGAKLVAGLFSRRGWRQVGFIGENRENFSTRQRYDAFIAQTSGMTVTSRFCDGGGYQAGHRAARELVAENPGVQALFCATDMLALGAWTACGTPPPPPATGHRRL